MAFDAESGDQLWARRTQISPLTLAANGSQLYFHDGERVVALNQKSGEPAWQTDPLTRPSIIHVQLWTTTGFAR